MAGSSQLGTVKLLSTKPVLKEAFSGFCKCSSVSKDEYGIDAIIFKASSSAFEIENKLALR